MIADCKQCPYRCQVLNAFKGSLSAFIPVDNELIKTPLSMLTKLTKSSDNANRLTKKQTDDFSFGSLSVKIWLRSA